MDIFSTEGFPGGNLSNFHAHAFEFDGVHCASMEGLLQSLKFADLQKQRDCCLLVGRRAKFKGKRRNKAWKRTQTLWWKGRAFARDSDEFQGLLDRMFFALGQNPDFQRALLATGSEVLTHSMGSSDPANTVLTEQEFCSRLMDLREWLLEEQ